MLNKLKIWLAVILTVAFMFTATTWAALDPSAVLHEEVYRQPVAEGVTYEKTTRFTPEGWLVIHTLEVNLRQKSVKVAPLISPSGISEPMPLDEIARDAGAVAAINADFFSMEKNAFTIGPAVSEGELISTPSRDDMAVFSLLRNGKAQIGPWKWQGRIMSGDDGAEIGAINKTGINSGKVLIFTPEWGKTAPVFENASGMVEAVFKNNRLVELHDSSSGGDIPEKGFVAVAGGAGAEFLKSLKKGKRISLELSVEPGLDGIYAAVGGGAVLVRDGKALTEFSHNVPGRHPRTAVGVTKDGKTLYMVVVEGRYDGSTGMDQAELAKLMESIGCYTALNLDGGGSSTMVVRPLGEKEATIFNKVADGAPRRIPEGLGILQKSSSKTLGGIVIYPGDVKTPLQSAVAFTALGYDTYFNPLDIKQSEIKWSVSGDIGRFDDNIFIAEKPGTGVVTASVKGKKATAAVKVLKDAVRMEIYPSEATLKPGQAINFSAYVYDSDGYGAVLDPSVVKWDVSGIDATVSNGRLTAGSTAATGVVTASYSNLTASAQVRTGTAQRLLDDFTGETCSFSGYPAGIAGGSLEKTSPPALLFSPEVVKLSYKFSPEPVTQVAYMVYDGNGLALPEGSTKLSAWVEASRGNGHWLRALLTDARGKEIYLTLARNADWTGWQKVTADIPADAKHPVRLRKVYVAETDANKLDSSGYIYIDRLTVEAPPEYPHQPEAPEPYRSPENRVVPDGEFNNGDFKFILFGDTKLTSASEEKKAGGLKLLKQAETGKLVHFTVFAGRLSSDEAISAAHMSDTVLSIFGKPLYFTGRTYYSKQIGDNLFIFLDASGGGLRAAAPEQWVWLKSRLAEAGKHNVFVVLNQPPSAFKDARERALLERLLEAHAGSNGTGAWVLYGGVDRFEQYARNGVRYLGTPGFNTPVPHYVEFSLAGGKISYRLVPLARDVQLPQGLTVNKGDVFEIPVSVIYPDGAVMPAKYPYIPEVSCETGGLEYNAQTGMLSALKPGMHKITVTIGDATASTVIEVKAKT